MIRFREEESLCFTEALETLKYVAMYTKISSNSVKESIPHGKR